MDENSRYLMLISEGNDGSDIIKYLLTSLGKKYIELMRGNYNLYSYQLYGVIVRIEIYQTDS